MLFDVCRSAQAACAPTSIPHCSHFFLFASFKPAQAAQVMEAAGSLHVHQLSDPTVLVGSSCSVSHSSSRER
jgi:hypothetical protein